MGQLDPGILEDRVKNLEKGHIEFQESLASMHKAQEQTLTMITAQANTLQGWGIRHDATDKKVYKNSIHVEAMQKSLEKSQIEQRESQERFQDSITKKLNKMVKRDWATLVTLIIFICGFNGAFIDYRLQPIVEDLAGNNSTNRRQYDFYNNHTDQINNQKTELVKYQAIVGELKERINNLFRNNNDLRDKVIRIETKEEIEYRKRKK